MKISNKLIETKANRLTDDQKLILMLYTALTKESWEEGPSTSEAVAACRDWFYWRNYDESQFESASEGLKALSGAAFKKSGRRNGR